MRSAYTTKIFGTRSEWLPRRLVLLGVLVVVLLGVSAVRGLPKAFANPSPGAPVLAYYYIWFDMGSWDRAKTDFPVLGRYSSDDRGIMEEHVRLAKQAGINGFIVSWKSTEKLNRRLEKLIEVANEQDFKLSIIYQGLDFHRKPLPLHQIETDVDYFMEQYADNPVFDMFEKPLMIWSGTWEFSADEVGKVAVQHRDRLFLLASEKNIAGYRRLSPFVDGNAYYWSSVNPDTFPGYQQKLTEMANAVREENGIWIAPAAPGFDARLIGGTRIVDRQDGSMLRRQMEAARASSPDAIGLISWNEFSENSHIEPSVNYGTRSIEVLSEIQGTTFRDGIASTTADFDSSMPGTADRRPGPLFVLGVLAALLLACPVVIARRTSRDRRMLKRIADA